MLRRFSRQRSAIVPLLRIRYQSASAVAVKPEHEDGQDGYGMDYGAGPSRIPYQPNRRDGAVEGSESSLDRVVLAPGSSLASTRLLRCQLHQITHGHYQSIQTFLNAMSESPPRVSTKRERLASVRPVSALSRIELHVLVHHLIRCDQPILAALLMSEAIRAGISSKPKRRRLFATRTIDALLSAYPNDSPAMGSKTSVNQSDGSLPYLTAFTQNKQLAPTSTPSLPRRTRVLLDLLSSMQEVRHRRSPAMYRLLIENCLRQRRPDAAAKIFVGLVEEWVTEGRVAEGADVDDFCEGGGPNDRLEIQLVSDQMATWWQGVRTWKLPGEVLSPHGRLDLWHPKNLSLGEKMKGFPMPLPTSPPSMVPAPDNDLLTRIIDSVHVDPATCTPEEHTASMRALAYLANTVLSRTLPISSLRALFTAMAATKHRPAVYPESVDIEKIPESDRWAYESFTQIHLALQSLLSAPPMSASSIEYANQVERARKAAPGVPAHAPPAPSPYMLRPLNWTSCLELLRYGMSRLRSPKVVRNLVSYMKRIFGEGHTSPKAHNVMLEGAIRLRDKSLGHMVTKALFGSLLSESPAKGPSTGTSPTAADHELTPGSHHALTIDHPDSKLDPEANERSLTTLVVHLTVTSRFAELESLIYDLIPFLSTSGELREKDDRERLEHLPLTIYPVLLEGLRKAGKSGLAQRVYKLALQAETAAMIRYDQLSETTQNRTAQPHLPFEVFTSMMNVWAGEVRACKGEGQWVKGWQIDKQGGVLKRLEAAQHLAWATYLEARKGWRLALHHGQKGAFRPDAVFYRALFRSCGERWRLDEVDWHHRAAEAELERIVSDMEAFDIAIPAKVARKLGMEPIYRARDHDTSKRDPAIDLAKMFFDQEGRREQQDRADGGRL